MDSIFIIFNIIYNCIFRGDGISCLCVRVLRSKCSPKMCCCMNSGVDDGKNPYNSLETLLWSIILLMSLDRLFCPAPSGSCCTNCSRIVQRLFSNLLPCQSIFQINPFDIFAEIASIDGIFLEKYTYRGNWTRFVHDSHFQIVLHILLDAINCLVLLFHIKMKWISTVYEHIGTSYLSNLVVIENSIDGYFVQSLQTGLLFASAQYKIECFIIWPLEWHHNSSG